MSVVFIVSNPVKSSTFARITAVACRFQPPSLAGTNFSVGQANLQAAFDRSVQGITSEARRIAVPITPVNPNGDELYHILRKRLFNQVAHKPEIERVASSYRDALREANKMNLITTTPESMFNRVVDSYPFHPDLRELVGKFKENDGFQ